LPAGQDLQEEKPDDARYLPLGQFSHEVDPDEEL
jgi:hypothetical protein